MRKQRKIVLRFARPPGQPDTCPARAGRLSAAQWLRIAACDVLPRMATTPAQLARELTPEGTDGAASTTFYQSRVSLFFHVIAGLSLVFFLLHNLLEVWSGNLSAVQVLTFPLNHFHLGGVAIAAAMGFVTRLAPLGSRALGVIEVGGTLAVLTCDDLMASALLGVNAPHFDLVLTLIYVLFQMTRAVIVPSSVRRTVLVCVVGALPLLFMAWLLAVRAPDAWSAKRTTYAPLYIALWCLDSAIPAALASGVIYGLRRQVREARRLGQYTLQERLGQGGMGTVYRAQHALLRRPTALKLLRPERAGEQALARFEREVQQTSRLSHPNTVSIFDYGRTADGVFYYAMEFLDGLDLQRLVDSAGAQPPARVVHVLVQVCRALHEAHGLALIHRDIKPANIILCERGGAPDVVKVVDFGLVKSLAGAQDVNLSHHDVIVGTPHYLAPEAIRSATEVDARTDLYALGAVGYFMLAGRPVFDGETALEVCSHQLSTPPTPLAQRPGLDVPAALDAVIMACLAKDPAARPPSALALEQALLACQVPVWSDAEARAFWASRREQQGAAAISDTRQQPTPTLLDVDVSRRVRSA